MTFKFLGRVKILLAEQVVLRLCFHRDLERVLLKHRSNDIKSTKTSTGFFQHLEKNPAFKQGLHCSTEYGLCLSLGFYHSSQRSPILSHTDFLAVSKTLQDRSDLTGFAFEVYSSRSLHYGSFSSFFRL